MRQAHEIEEDQVGKRPSQFLGKISTATLNKAFDKLVCVSLDLWRERVEIGGLEGVSDDVSQ